MMAISRNSKLVGSLINYISDIKPYHTKLKQFTSELFFEEKLAVAVTDESPELEIQFSNVWAGDEESNMSFIAEGNSSDLQTRIPPAQLRTSVVDLIDEVPYDVPIVNFSVTRASVISDDGTTLVGSVDILVNLDLSDSQLYGIDTAVVQATYGDVTLTHATSGSQVLIANTTLTIDLTTFPYGNTASALYLLHKHAEVQPLSIQATADTGRYAIPASIDATVELDDVALEPNVDYVLDVAKSTVQFLAGRHPPGGVLKARVVNDDELYVSLTAPLVVNTDVYTLTVDNSPQRHTVQLNGSQGIKPKVSEVMIYPGEVEGAVWRIKAKSFFSVTVERLLPTPLAAQTATLNSRFDNGLIAFTLKSGGAKHKVGSNPTQVGRIITIGDSYYFLLNTPQARGVLVELRLEQVNQYNPRLSISLSEDFKLVVIREDEAV